MTGRRGQTTQAGPTTGYRLQTTEYRVLPFRFPLLRPIIGSRTLASLGAVTGLGGCDVAEKLPVIMNCRRACLAGWRSLSGLAGPTALIIAGSGTGTDT